MLATISTSTLLGIGIPVVGLILLFIFSGKEYFRNKSQSEDKSAWTDLKKLSVDHMLPLRLTAYERLTLLTERMSPSNLLVRVSPQGLTAGDMHAVCLNEVRNEYEHNLAQQLYVSENAWQAVKKCKDETLLLLNAVAATMPPNAAGLDYCKAVLAQSGQSSVDHYSLTTSILRKDVANY